MVAQYILIYMLKAHFNTHILTPLTITPRRLFFTNSNLVVAHMPYIVYNSLKLFKIKVVAY